MIYDKKEIQIRFGAKLKEYRKNAKLTQEELAEKTGCSWQTISGIETGYSFPSSTTLFNLSNALNVPLVCLFDFYDKQIKDDKNAKFINLFDKLDKNKKDILLKIIQAMLD